MKLLSRMRFEAAPVVRRALIGVVVVASMGTAGLGIGTDTVSAGASTYYVHCVAGTDSGTGSSPQPWKSSTKASAAKLVAGDRLLLARGCVWNGQRLNAPWHDQVVGHGCGATEDQHVFDRELETAGEQQRPVQPVVAISHPANLARHRA